MQFTRSTNVKLEVGLTSLNKACNANIFITYLHILILQQPKSATLDKTAKIRKTIKQNSQNLHECEN